MGTFVEDSEDNGGDELSTVEQLIQTEPTVEEANPVDVPSKYKGKSIEDVIKMHQEAEKLIGKQAQEVGEVRKLADDLIKQTLSKPSAPTEVRSEEHTSELQSLA